MEYACKKDLLAICGTAETLQVAPFGDKNYEKWAVAVCRTYPVATHLDCLFELHTSGYWRDPGVLERLQKETVPVYMHEKYVEVPQSIRYPIEDVIAYRRYLTSTISYMLALAYHSFLTVQKPKQVSVFGVNMFTGEEYGEQRPCCEYWIGRMEGVGMTVEMAAGSAVLSSSGLYGYENYEPICYELQKRITGIQMGIDVSRREKERFILQEARNEGAKIEAEYWLNRYQKGRIPKDASSS